MHNPRISIIIPTLNEAGNLRRLMPRIKAVLKGRRYEILVVDGHSADGTAEVAHRLGAHVVYDSVGKGSALMKGIRASAGDVLVLMDADLSHRPDELLILIAGIEAGYDICMGSRFLTGGGSDDMPAHRRFGNFVFVSLVNLLYGSRYSDLCYGYRSFAKGVAQRLHLSESGFGIEAEISIKAVKAGMKVMEVPSYEKLRLHGSGKLRSLRDGQRILYTILKNM